MSTIKELKQEATELGIQFSPNIGEAKLKDKIDEHYDAQVVPVETVKTPKTNESLEVKMRRAANEVERKARKTRIVTIIDNDSRENNLTTAVTATCACMSFDLGQQLLPLNMPIEVMQGHIDSLKDVFIPHHVKDTNTGTTTIITRPRYTIAFEDMEK